MFFFVNLFLFQFKFKLLGSDNILMKKEKCNMGFDEFKEFEAVKVCVILGKVWVKVVGS